MELAKDTLEVKELYKFRAIPRDSNNELDESKLHHVERIFTHNELYFPSPVDLNDPLEFRPNMVLGDLSDPGYKNNYVDYFKPLMVNSNPNPEATPENVEAWLKTHLQDEAEGWTREFKELYWSNLHEKYRVCSLCATATNPLVWSHYSDSHKGFCLVFDASKDIFGGALKVHYSDKYPTLDITEPDDMEVLYHSALTKMTDWKYEEEYRLLSMEPNEPMALPVENKKLIFPTEMLVAVIFGCRISDNDKKLIEGWCLKRKNKIELREAKLSDTEYKLEIEVLGST